MNNFTFGNRSTNLKEKQCLKHVLNQEFITLHSVESRNTENIDCIFVNLYHVLETWGFGMHVCIVMVLLK